MARTDQPNAADGVTPADTRPPQRSGDRDVLAQRLRLLPPSHPSSPDYDAPRTADTDTQPPAEAASGDRGAAARPSGTPRGDARPSTADAPPPADAAAGAPGKQPDSPAPAGTELASSGHAASDKTGPPKLTDDHAVRAPWIRAKLAETREQLATVKQYRDKDGIWLPARRDAHSAIVNDLYEAASGVPCERKAIMAGGLGGAGKSTVLEHYAGIGQSEYLKINPDIIKEELAKRGMIPEVDGLSPMEASDLVHEESSRVARALARRAMADGKNLIWDITMNRSESVQSRLNALDAHGYSTRGVFVDITISEALKRADARHRVGHEEYLNGEGYGGRFTPSDVIKSQADPEWGSINRRVFEEAKPRFTEWEVYDNNGTHPRLVEAYRIEDREEDR